MPSARVDGKVEMDGGEKEREKEEREKVVVEGE